MENQHTQHISKGVCYYITRQKTCNDPELWEAAILLDLAVNKGSCNRHRGLHTTLHKILMENYLSDDEQKLKKTKPTIISLSEFNESGIQFDEKY